MLVLVSLFAAAASAPAAGVSIAADDPGLRYTGRFDFSTPTAPRFGWPGVMIEAAFSGTSVGIKLAEQFAYPNYFDAIIDGGAPRRLTSSSASVVTHSISGLAAGTHTLKLIRRGESFNGATSGQEYSIFQGLDLDAGASLSALPAPPVRRIEVIGDSLSVGYGNEGPGLSCSGTVPQYTNNYKAYGTLVAQTFCAEVHSTCISGHGVASNYGDGTSSPYPLPALFNRTLPGSSSPAWDFNSWQPDAVVIFLGTNDFSTGSAPPNAPSQAQYEAAYNALIADIRAKYAASNPWIFCLHHTTWDGSANFDFGPYVTSVVAYQNGTMGDAKVVGVDMDPYAGSACDYHPSVAEDQAMANRLRIAISAATGWVAGSCPVVGTPTPTRTPSPAYSATITPTPGGSKLYCLHLDYSAVPALVNDRKITVKVDVGSCSSVSVTVDGTPVAASYSGSTATFSTTGSDVIISANGWTSGGTGAATKAYLYGDKHWAHSLTLDYGIQSQWDNAKPVLDARSLRAGIALNASGIQGGNPWNMTWAEAQALRAAGWDVFNHSYSHPTITCANFATEFQQNQTLFASKFPGYNVTHIVYPFEDTTAAGCAGWPPSFILSAEGGGGLNYVDAAFPNVYRLYRNGLYGSSSAAWQTSATSARNNARPTWLITITHSVAAASSAPADAYSTNADTLAAYLDFLMNNYGPTGDNSLWFAPSGEVYDYTLTRDNVAITSASCGTPTPSPTACGACTSTSTLTETPTRTATRTATPTPPCSPSVFDDMDDGDNQNATGSYWWVYPGTGTSTVNPATFAMTAPGYGGSGYCARVYGNADVTGLPGLGSSLPTLDYSAYSGLTFWAKGDGKQYRFQLHSAVEGGNYNDYKYDFTAPAGWSLISIPWTSLAFPGWGPAYSLDTTQVVSFSWVPLAAGSYDLSVDLISLTCAGTPTPTASATPTRTPTASPTATPSASPSASPVLTATPTFTVSPVFSATVTPTATPTSTSTLSFTASPTATLSPVLSPTPTATNSPVVSPSSTVTSSVTTTLTLTYSLTASPTPSGTPTLSHTLTRTATLSLTLTQSPAFTATSTVTVTPSATPTAMPTQTGGASGPPTAGPEGPLVIQRTLPYPQPNPSSIRINVEGATDRCVLRLFSPAYTCLGRLEGPAQTGAGWVSVPLGVSSLAPGLYFYEMEAQRGNVRSKTVTGRLMVLR